MSVPISGGKADPDEKGIVTSMQRSVSLETVSQAVGLEEAKIKDATFCENKKMPCIL